MLTAVAKVDWLDLPHKDLVSELAVLQEGICRGVFKQKAAPAWFGVRSEKIQISLILPGPSLVDDWIDILVRQSHLLWLI